MTIIVIGGSAAGRIAALLLARAGHVVVVIERDHLEPAPDVETAAATAFRASAPQIVQPHVLLATFRTLVRERLPDVYAALLAAGVVEADVVSQLPGGVTDRAAQPGDHELGLLLTRRATLDLVLGRAVATEPGVEVRYGVQVTGLLADAGDPPRARGVATDHGDLTGDLVVDAAGRRTGIDRWLTAIGGRPSQVEQAECGVAYYSRQYRLRDDTPPAPANLRVVAGLTEFTVGIWPADNGSAQIALAPLATDRRFTPARHPDVFTAVLRTVPFFAAWLDVLDPITDVTVMGGLHNTLRRLVVDGRPVVTGLLAVGDAVCTTNPTFGRGLSMVLRGAINLVDVLAAHPHDPYEQVLAMDRAVAEHVAPWFADQAASDQARLAMLRHTIEGAPPPPVPTPDPGRITFGELRSAAQVDAAAYRGVWRSMGMVGRPADVYEDPTLVARVRTAIAGGLPPMLAQPTRDELEAALRG